VLEKGPLLWFVDYPEAEIVLVGGAHLGVSFFALAQDVVTIAG